jgi:septal ring factor EnvC (AmiA/AmiB activator)
MGNQPQPQNVDMAQVMAMLAAQNAQNAPKTQPTVDQMPFLMTPKVMVSVIGAIVGGAIWATMQFSEIKRDIQDVKNTPAKVATLETSQTNLKSQVDTMNASLVKIQAQMDTVSININNISSMLNILQQDIKNVKGPNR